MLPEFSFEEESVPLEEDSILIVYSDGVTEAMNAEEEMFGDDRIAALLDQHKYAPASEIIDQLVAAVKKHANGYPQSDDITVVVVRRT